MTKLLSIEEYRRAVGLDAEPRRPATTGRSDRKKKLALLVFIEEVRRELGITFLGAWREGADTESRVMYLEYPAIPGRKFRFDLAVPALRLLVDIQGGAGVMRTGPGGKLSYGGAHHSIDGRRRDIHKNNLARIHGYDVIECEWSDVESGQLFSWVRELLERRGLTSARDPSRLG